MLPFVLELTVVSSRWIAPTSALVDGLAITQLMVEHQS
jgi:hypothetical protein